MGVPVTEFRSFDITGSEPSDRTSEGSVVDESTPLALGTANITSGKQQQGPFCLIFRVSDLDGFSTVNVLKAGVTANSALSSNAKFYVDITDTWTQNKTVAQVIAGSPGLVSNGIPSVANLEKNGGGDIAGIDHANTSKYIYVVVEVASDESVGTDKGNTDGTLAMSCQFDYS